MRLATQVEPYRSWKEREKEKKRRERIYKRDESLRSGPEWAGRGALELFCVTFASKNEEELFKRTSSFKEE